MHSEGKARPTSGIAECGEPLRGCGGGGCDRTSAGIEAETGMVTETPESQDLWG